MSLLIINTYGYGKMQKALLIMRKFRKQGKQREVEKDLSGSAMKSPNISLL